MYKKVRTSIMFICRPSRFPGTVWTDYQGNRCVICRVLIPSVSRHSCFSISDRARVLVSRAPVGELIPGEHTSTPSGASTKYFPETRHIPRVVLIVQRES